MTKSILIFEPNSNDTPLEEPTALEPQIEQKTKKEKPPKPPKYKRPKATSTEGHYVTNAVLLPEMLRAKALGRVTPELAEMFLKIATRYSMSKNYAHLSSIRDDMISNAVLNLLQNGLKFNPEKSSNPFSYTTQCCYHSFLMVIAEEKKQREIRDTLLLDNGVNASLGHMEKEHDSYREKHAEFFDNE
jgi:hypothetical protein